LLLQIACIWHLFDLERYGFKVSSMCGTCAENIRLDNITISFKSFAEEKINELVLINNKFVNFASLVTISGRMWPAERQFYYDILYDMVYFKDTKRNAPLTLLWCLFTLELAGDDGLWIVFTRSRSFSLDVLTCPTPRTPAITVPTREVPITTLACSWRLTTLSASMSYFLY
jgi:hypothetical protein